MKTRLLMLAMLCAAAACQSASEKKQDDDDDVAFVVLEDWAGVNNVPMDTGTNVRHFNKIFGTLEGVKVVGDSALQLSAGTYRLSGFSITTFGYTTGQKVFAAPGYAFVLRTDTTTPSIAILGSMQDAQYSAPSFVDGLFTIESGTHTYELGHQQGSTKAQVAGIFLDMGQPPDPHHQGGHLFARLVVQRLAE